MDFGAILKDHGISGLLVVVLAWIARQLVQELRAFRRGILGELVTLRVNLERLTGRIERAMELPPERSP